MKPGTKLSKADLARAAERLRRSNPAGYLGFHLVKAERGRAVIRMPVLDLHKQIHRVVHGGVVAMLADTAGGFAAFLAEPEGTRVVTIEMKINFLEAVEHGEITADARVIRRGRTVSVVDCDVTDAERRLVGKALMTFAIIQKKVERASACQVLNVSRTKKQIKTKQAEARSIQDALKFPQSYWPLTPPSAASSPSL